MAVQAGTHVNALTADGTPRAVANVDIRKLPIGPSEAFVLSRVDGRSSVHEIGLTTGFTHEQVVAALGLLAALGAVTWPGAPEAKAPTSTEATREAPRARKSRRPGSSSQTPAASAPLVGSSEPVTRAATEVAITERCAEMTVEQQLRIETLARDAREKNHYALLGVTRTATRAEIREAYFAIVADVHPDKFFGKDLGPLKARLEQLFKHLTEAHDTLTRARRRSEYDATLPAETVVQLLTGETSDPAVASAASAAAPATTRTASVPSPLPPLSASAPSRPPPVARAETSGPVSGRPRSRSSATRAAVAQSARRNSNSAPPLVSTPPSSVTAATAPSPRMRPLSGAFAAPISQRPMRSVGHPSLPPASLRPKSPTQRYIDAADIAAREGSPLSALNSLRIAASLAPNDEALRDRISALEAQIDIQQSDRLSNEAQEAQKRGDHASAARIYARLARATSDPAHFRRGAECALEAGAHQQAADLARRALAIREKDVQLHMLLARVYVEAKMLSSATREFERAHELAPNDENVKDWLKRIKRGDV